MSKRTAFICLFVVLVAAGLFVTGHGPHVIGYLPYLVLLACPLMHIFMHHGHQRRDVPHQD